MKMLKATSPINLVEKIEAPLLMSTGSKDQKIPQEHNDLMAERMFKAGNKITYFYYPDEGHDYRDPESWISFWAFTEEFLAKHLGGKNESIEKGKSVGDYELVYYKGEKVNE
jgi:dipeptidyl aminopeptidase/acylaminoacyl peptidase